MAILIGENNPSNIGEKIFLSKVCEYLDDSYVIYRNRQVFGREFDACILLPNKGVLVVEVKGWREETVSHVADGDTIIIHTEDGDVPASPQKQARSYRFSLERFIRQNTGKFPLVFQMVCLPQVSRQFYHRKRLDVATEERFTFLKEDLLSKADFFAKMNQALREVSQWNRDPFDLGTMLEVRKLFEPEDSIQAASGPASTITSPLHGDYSRFYFFTSTDRISEYIPEMVSQYSLGCKLYCVFSSQDQLRIAVEAINNTLAEKSLVRDGSDLKLSFDSKATAPSLMDTISNSFTAFNCSFTVCSKADELQFDSIRIINGNYTAEEQKALETLADRSTFNADQYFIEHADPSKNIIIRAGAGTGKTHSMISRIGFLCYTQNVPLIKMADRIVMITFTNETAEQMKCKVKDYFKNCYLLTSRADYMNIISHIDNMQISTIHSYARKLIAALGTEFGYGIDVSITSSEFYRRKKISDEIDIYIRQKQQEQGLDYPEKLGVPIYEIQDRILDFITRLHNKSIDVGSITPENFGILNEDNSRQELHELLAYVIPKVEKEYMDELRDDNRVHLSTLMSILHRFISEPASAERIKELKKDSAPQFMFIDEFQDTDDAQIEILMKLANIMDYRMFVVGDIKQCIYRFRGAKERAFDQLGIAEHPDQWLQFSLRRNYRTDKHLLNLFDLSFSSWGQRPDELLAYRGSEDRLIGMREYNGYILPHTEKFYSCITIDSDDRRIPALVEELHRLQKRIAYEEQRGTKLSSREKSIAILVRENWQANLIKKECRKLDRNLNIQTCTGGDLYSSQPALDMLILVNALVHFDEADYLYNLANSNFFNLNVPKSNLYSIRRKISEGAWRNKADERDLTNALIHYMNPKLVNSLSEERTWEEIISSLREKPVLQALRQIYSTLRPWENYSDEEEKQQYYRMNVDLLFEQIIGACNIDKLTVNTLQQFLHGCISAQTPVNSRSPLSEDPDVPIQCLTVHKSKGLEYGHVILPYGAAPIDKIKQSQLHISTTKGQSNLRIGYSMQIGSNHELIHNDYYDELTEKAEKAREETRILYVAMTRAIRSFSWIAVKGKQNLSWQNLIQAGDNKNAL